MIWEIARSSVLYRVGMHLNLDSACAAKLQHTKAYLRGYQVPSKT